MLAGKKVFILRIGMAGSLAYEVHGATEDALDVYNEILRVGKDYGLQRLGRHAYRNTHTEGGFPQNTIHYCPPTPEEGLAKFSAEHLWGGAPYEFPGSAGSDRDLHARNPIELGWSKAVKFDHEFPGRAALEKEAEHPSSQPMTLVWNKEDIFDVWKSVFDEGEPYKLMPLCEDVNPHIGSASILTDKVLLDGKEIGLSSGRMFSPKTREMISLGAIKPEYCIEGTEVIIVWGDPGKRQKNIRATLKAWPYLSENRNENIDVTKLPSSK